MGTNSSVEASFQFLNYKIDKIDFQLTPKSNYILGDSSYKYEFTTKFGFRSPEKFKDKKSIFYISGLRLQLEIKNTIPTSEVVAKGDFSISGVFVTKDGLTKKNEENLAKYQIPAILFPYLRAAITNILASSGFHNIVVPLVNIREAAKTSNIEIIDRTSE